MKIGIIGAGHIGATLTRRLTQLGHDVTVANSRGPETLKGLAAETGARAGTVTEAATDKEVVIVTIPEKSVPELPKGLFDNSRAVVVDTGNYYPQRDGRIGPIESGTTESRWVSQQLGRPVVKAFNTILAKHLLDDGRPSGDRKRIALPIAGDDPNAKTVVSRLIDELGFDAVDAGGLDDSWRQQPGTPVYGADLTADKARHALGEAKRAR
jgi:8-hydroxy-5-deazaflavin:NADPH oxidoreductase